MTTLGRLRWRTEPLARTWRRIKAGLFLAFQPLCV